MADSDNLPIRKLRKRKLEMFQPFGEGSSLMAKQGTVTTNKRKQSSCCRKMEILNAGPPRKLKLCDLPLLIIRKILQFIPVDDLEILANTNRFFYNWICSEHRTSADIPFKKEDIKIMQENKIIEKKPLMKLRCKDFNSNPFFKPILPKYIMDLQMSLLDFSKLRELDLVLSTDNLPWVSPKVQVRHHNLLTDVLLQVIRRNGTLSRIEKFDVLVDEFGESTIAFLPDMIKLRDFGLNILSSTNLRENRNHYYLPMLEKAVSSSRASLLRLNVMSETKRKVGKKLLRSDHIQRIQFTGPCSFNGALFMPNLEVVEIDCGKYCSNRSRSYMNTIFSRITGPITNVHVVGKCGLMAASIYQNCPSIKEFSGVPLDDIDPKQNFSKWNAQVKQRFYKDYEKSCRYQPAILEFKDWVNINWFTTRYPPAAKQ